jgi:DNA-binding MarR family transcriptional regulator
MTDPRQTAARAWALMFELLEAERPRMLKLGEQFEMSPVEMFVMRSLHSTGGPCGMQNLAASKFHDKSTVTRVIDRLVKRGLVDRTENPADRRVKDVALTASGSVLAGQILLALANPPPSVAELSDEDRQHLVDVLERAVESAREQSRAGQ